MRWGIVISLIIFMTFTAAIMALDHMGYGLLICLFFAYFCIIGAVVTGILLLIAIFSVFWPSIKKKLIQLGEKHGYHYKGSIFRSILQKLQEFGFGRK